MAVPSRLLPRRLARYGCAAAVGALVPLAALVQRRDRPTALDEAVRGLRPPLSPGVDDALDLAALLVPAVMPLVGAALAVLCWRRGGHRAAALCLLGPVAAYATTALLKPALARPSASGSGWMFPSGHVTVVAAVALVAAVLLRPHGVLAARSTGRRAVGWALVLAVPLATATGTVLNRHHHATDVVGAALVATVAVLAVAGGLDRLRPTA